MTPVATRKPRPERVLLLIVPGEGDAKGRAIRLNDESELRFGSLAELTDWLRSSGKDETGA